MTTRPLLMAPAGSFAALTAALQNGADAIYLGVREFNMRAAARNFEVNQLARVADQTHASGASAYLTLNVQVYSDELDRAKRLLEQAKEAGMDAVIAWDPAVISHARAIGLPFHISTQASVANIDSALYYASLGAKAVVLARELSLQQIAEIVTRLRALKNPLKIEIFAHGAMCVAISGRCFLSHHAFGRSGNRGECTQPCRRKYTITDREGELSFGLEEHTLLSPKDLCTLPILGRVLKAGPHILKLEGRNRSPEYVALVTRTYREAIDRVVAGDYDDHLLAQHMERLEGVYNKKFHSGFLTGFPGGDDFTDVENSAGSHKKIYLGRVGKVFKRAEVFDLQMHTGHLNEGSMVMIIGPRTGVREGRVESMRDEDHKRVATARKGEVVGCRLTPWFPVRPGDKVFLYEPREGSS